MTTRWSGMVIREDGPEEDVQLFLTEPGYRYQIEDFFPSQV